jgi:predicted XRE-type DNA-binding protein
MSEKRTNRSNKYQFLFGEISVATEMLESFNEDASIYKRLNPHEYNEAVAELEERLKIEFWRLVDDNLTKRQKQVIELISIKKMTQQEAAKILGVNQSSITKSLNGNVDYSKKDENNKKTKIVYGGSLRRLRKLCQEDEKIIEILKQIADLREETWTK